MTLRIGRATLSAPQAVPYDRRGAAGAGVAGPLHEKGFRVAGLERGSASQTSMDSLEKEALRLGDVWCQDSDAAIPSGHYRIEDAAYVKPSGSPKARTWDFTLVKKDRPVIHRQAEDDNVAGADTADATCEEATKVVYTATAGEVDVLKPLDVAGYESLNLPAGEWKFIARVQSRTTATQKFRVKVVAIDGTVLSTGSQATAGVADAWVEVDLGSFTVADADSGANAYKLTVQANGDLNDVWIDRVKVVPA